MEKIKITRVNKDIIIEKLDNGLTIIFCKTKEFIVKCAFFCTKYGSKDLEFIPINENKMTSFPQGVAHFLEHKVFEQKNGEIVFDIFSKNLADANAYTSQDRTNYHFSCSENFYENLETLLDFVQSPYFTNKNVEKEKGIISQELEMYNDNPNWTSYRKKYESLFSKSGYKYDIGGSVPEIMKITKEDLYKCYNTFYNPSNMFLVITGDLDENEVINFVKKNQSKKKYDKQKEIIRKEIEEPEEVKVKKLEFKDNVVTQKSTLAYKIKFKDTKDENMYLKEKYIDIYLMSLFGNLTTFKENMIKDKVIKSDFWFYSEKADGYMVISFEGNTIKHNKFKNKINKIINIKNPDKESFENYRKYFIERVISDYETPLGVCNRLFNLYFDYNKIFSNLVELIESLNYKDYTNFIKSLDFSNKTEIIMKPNNK